MKITRTSQAALSAQQRSQLADAGCKVCPCCGETKSEMEYFKEGIYDGDIYLNPCFGDLWVVDGASFIKINNGYAIELDEPEGFIKVGHIDGVINKRSQPTK